MTDPKPLLSEKETAAIRDEAEKFAFQVPYNGSKDFYNDDKYKGYIAGATFMALRAKEREAQQEEIISDQEILLGLDHYVRGERISIRLSRIAELESQLALEHDAHTLEMMERNEIIQEKQARLDFLQREYDSACEDVVKRNKEITSLELQLKEWAPIADLGQGVNSTQVQRLSKPESTRLLLP